MANASGLRSLGQYYNLNNIKCSGFGTVGRVVAFSSRGPGLQLCHWQFTKITVIYNHRLKRRKRGRELHILKALIISGSQTSERCIPAHVSLCSSATLTPEQCSRKTAKQQGPGVPDLHSGRKPSLNLRNRLYQENTFIPCSRHLCTFV